MSLQSTPRPLNGPTSTYHVNTRTFDDKKAITLGPRKNIAKIDGLFIGLKLVNEMDGSSINPHAGSFTSHSHNIKNPEVPISLSTKRGTVTSSNGAESVPLDQQLSQNPSPPNYDWSSIIKVREGMKEVWRCLQGTFEGSPAPQIRAVQMLYQNFSDFCDAGALSIRATLTGAIPNQLKQVFALTSMAFVILDLLPKTSQSPGNDIWKDICTWRNAIVNLDEQNTFHLVVEILWPVASAHLCTLPAHNDSPALRIPLQFRPSDFTRPSSSTALLPNYMGSQCSSVLVNSSDISSHTPLSSYPSTYSDPYLHQQSTDEVDQNYDLNGPFSWLQGPICSNGGPFPSTANDQAYHASQEASMSPTSLRDTDAFRAIEMYCSHMGELPYLLSGKGMTVKVAESCSAFVIENSQTRDQMSRVLLERLQSRSGSTNCYFRALLSAVESFVERGCLRSVGEAGNFMFTVGKVG